MARSVVWTLESAVEFARHVGQHATAAGWHVGIAGSVLHRGSSAKDLDLLVCPLRVPRDEPEATRDEELRAALRNAGMTMRFDRTFVLAAWRRMGSVDE